MLKFLAAFFMLIDHIGLLFFPNLEVFRIVGRLSMPLFAFCIARSFEYVSKNGTLKTYMLRLLGFCAVSQIPYMLFLIAGRRSFTQAFLSLNIGFTWLAAFVVLYLLQHVKSPIKYVAILLIALLSVTNFISYGVLGTFLPVAFYFFLCKTKKHEGLAFFSLCFLTFLYAFVLNAPMQLCSIPAFIFILMWNDYKKDKDTLHALRISLPKNFFYAFYPIHLTVLTVTFFVIFYNQYDAYIVYIADIGNKLFG